MDISLQGVGTQKHCFLVL